MPTSDLSSTILEGVRTKSEQAAESSRSQHERKKTPAIFASPDSPCSSLLRVCTGAVTSGAGCGLQASTVCGVAPLSGQGPGPPS